MTHKLTHVVQQTDGARMKESSQQHHMGRVQGKGNERPLAVNTSTVEIGQQAGLVPSIQRTVELRPPSIGEQSAFGRVDELIDRLNYQSAAIQYRLDVDGRTLKYHIIDVATLTHFDLQMQAFIDRAEVVPVRLITRTGLLGGSPVLVDAFVGAYVDLDDLLASDDLSFQLNLIHLLTERFKVRDYARRIGTAFSVAEFDRAHQAGLGAEAALLQDVVGDPTIRFNFEEIRPDGTAVFAFRSGEGYRIFHVFRGAGRLEQHGEIFVQTIGGRRLTIEELIKERAAAAAPAPAP